jgi:hypothetical protein
VKANVGYDDAVLVPIPLPTITISEKFVKISVNRD